VSSSQSSLTDWDLRLVRLVELRTIVQPKEDYCINVLSWRRITSSAKHLDAYVDELEHRFNNRDNQFLFRDTLLKLLNAEKLPYSELVKAA